MSGRLVVMMVHVSIEYRLLFWDYFTESHDEDVCDWYVVGLGYGWMGRPSTNPSSSPFNTRDGGIFSVYIDVSGTADRHNHIGECSRLSGYCFFFGLFSISSAKC